MTLLLPVAGAVAGAIVGSFLATLIIRWPRGEQAMTGRSHCDNCGRELSAAELIPIVSWFLTQGKCRSCGTSIPALHLWIEVAAAVMAAAALLVQPNLQGATIAVFWLLLLAPAVLDARHYWLPDSLTVALAIGGVLLGGYASGVELEGRLIGGAAGFASLWLIAGLYRLAKDREGLGKGDPKLLGAIGLWTGWYALPPIILVSALAGLAFAIAQGRTRLERMPFGTCLAAGAVLWTSLMAWRGAPLL